jgi:hypothetical protein
MPLKSIITDGLSNGSNAEVKDHALKVAVTEYERLLADVKFFINPIHGISMNKNFSDSAAGNSNEIIHNGIDSIEWTASAIIGTWDFASTNNPDTGTKNIEMISATIADTAQLNRGSDVTMNAHTGFAGRIYIGALGNPVLDEISFFAWDTGTGTQVGNQIDIYDYVSKDLIGVYQSFTIPLIDMGLVSATFDALRIQVAGIGGASFDLDNIVLLDPTGSSAFGSTLFSIEPDLGTELLIDSFTWNMAGVHAGTVPDGTMPDLPYDGFLNISTLDVPVIFQSWSEGEVSFTAPIQQLIDLMSLGSAKLCGHGSDGTNSWFSVCIRLAVPILLSDADGDLVTLRISSNLSSLLLFRVSSNCSYRVVS